MQVALVINYTDAKPVALHLLVVSMVGLYEGVGRSEF
jgi:hypothetical protein